MKILLIALLISMNALATEVNLDGIDDLSQDKYTAPLTEDYKADGDYKGRNENSANTLSNKTIAKSGSLSKSVSTTSSKKSAQYENLESNAGELVQKLEDDRIKVTKKYEGLYTESKDTVKDTYELTKQINIDNLGSEQDPNVTNAFKCKDSKNCNKVTDKRVIKECQSSEMLSWSGHEWSCISVFADPKSPKCDADQWYKPVSGGAACVNYIYEWKKTGYGACNSKALKEEVYSCNRKKTVSDSGTIVPDGKCLGDKPKGKSELCEANWNVGSWGSCNKTCGGGVQTRPVTCPANNVCNTQKPSTTQSCNIHSCAVNPTYKCNSGWNLSGSSCNKLVEECVYNSNNYWYITHGECQSGWNNGELNGRRVYSPYYKGKLKETNRRSCHSWDDQQFFEYYELCKKVTKTIAAIPVCPSGYAYNTSTKKCHK